MTRDQAYDLNTPLNMFTLEVFKNYPLPDNLFALGPRPTTLPDHQEGDIPLPHTENALRVVGPKSRELFERFLATPACVDIISHVGTMPPPSRQDRTGFRHALAGRVFEELAYFALCEQLQGSHIILSPQQTFHLFKLFHPKARATNDMGISMGIEGVVVPDGLLVKRNHTVWEIEAFLEYKLKVKDTEKQRRQRGGFLSQIGVLRRLSAQPSVGSVYLAKSFQRAFPQFSINAITTGLTLQLQYVVPYDVERPNNFSIPISRKDYGKLLQGITLDCGK